MSSGTEPTNGSEQKMALSNESIKQENPVAEFDGYVAIVSSEGPGATVLEVPTDDDNTLRLSTLEHSFPNAIGLKFKNPATGVYRTLAVNDDTKSIIEPKGGWATRRYVAIYRPDTQPALKGLKRPASPEAGLSDMVDEAGECVVQQRALTVPVDLVVLNIDFTTTKDSLVKYFEQFGKIEFAEIKLDRTTGKSKGYGFVKMSNLEDQQKVLTAAHLINGRVVEVRIPQRTVDPEAKKNRPDALSTKIHVGRVPDGFTVNDLTQGFSEKAVELTPHAKVDRVIIPSPRRGFAFVTFNDASVTKKFIDMRDVVINGVSLSVSYPTPRKEVDDSALHDPYGASGFTSGMPFNAYPVDAYGGAMGMGMGMGMMPSAPGMMTPQRGYAGYYPQQPQPYQMMAGGGMGQQQQGNYPPRMPTGYGGVRPQRPQMNMSQQRMPQQPTVLTNQQQQQTFYGQPPNAMW